MLTLALFVLGIFANHPQAAFAADNFAIPANGFYGCSYFHKMFLRIMRMLTNRC